MKDSKTIYGRISPRLHSFLDGIKKKKNLKSWRKLLLSLAIEKGFKPKDEDL